MTSDPGVGVSGQVVLRRLTERLSTPDPDGAQRVVHAVRGTGEIIISSLEVVFDAAVGQS